MEKYLQIHKNYSIIKLPHGVRVDRDYKCEFII